LREPVEVEAVEGDVACEVGEGEPEWDGAVLFHEAEYVGTATCAGAHGVGEWFVAVDAGAAEAGGGGDVVECGGAVGVGEPDV